MFSGKFSGFDLDKRLGKRTFLRKARAQVKCRGRMSRLAAVQCLGLIAGQRTWFGEKQKLKRQVEGVWIMEEIEPKVHVWS